MGDASEGQPVTIEIDAQTRVSGLVNLAEEAQAGFVLAHGAGAGMTHPFMHGMATRLSSRRISTLRFQFPYMEHGKRRPDPPERAHAAVRAAVEHASRALGTTRLFAGGKSFGGRMTSQAAAMGNLPAIAGLVFFGFPLHPAGKPSRSRADHLRDALVPMLFFHGGKDKLAEPAQFGPALQSLGALATVVELPEADHSFHVPAKSGMSDDDVQEELADRFAIWIQAWHLTAATERR